MKAKFHKLAEALFNFAGYVVTADLAFTCLMIVYSVIMRSVFNNPVKWQYELTLVCLCYAIFIGMPMCFYKDENLRLTFITNKLKPKVWAVYMTVIDLLLITFLVFGFVQSLSIIKTTWSQFYKTIAIRKGVYYLAFPIGAALSVVALIDQILQRKASDAPSLKNSAAAALPEESEERSCEA